MLRLFIFLLLATPLYAAQAQDSTTAAMHNKPAVELSIIKTSDITTLEALTYSGGDYTS